LHHSLQYRRCPAERFNELDRPVVVDENVIIGRFIYDIPQFVDAIVAQLN
jgi:hypothetical protein